MVDNTNTQTSGSNPSSAPQNVKVYYEPDKKDAGYQQTTEAADAGYQRSARADANRKIRGIYMRHEDEEKNKKELKEMEDKKERERQRLEELKRVARIEYDKLNEKGKAETSFYKFLKDRQEAQKKEREQKQRFEMFKESPKKIKMKVTEISSNVIKNLNNEERRSKMKKDVAAQEKQFKKNAGKSKDLLFGKAGENATLKFISKDMKAIQKGIKTSRGGNANYRVGSPDFRVSTPEATAQRLGGFHVVGIPDARPRQLPNQKTETLRQLPIDFVNVDVFRKMKTGRMEPLEKLSAEVRGKNPIDRMVGKPKQLKGKKVKVPTISFMGIEKKINKKGGLF